MNGFPDALMFPESSSVGRSMHDRVIALSKRCESLLGIDYAAGQRAHLRKATAGVIFVTANPYESIAFPIGHPRSGEPRYRWSRDDDEDVQLGFYIDDEARTAILLDPATIARLAADRRRGAQRGEGMIDEKAKRKPNFDERNSATVVLADGQNWHVPKPWLEIRPGRRRPVLMYDDELESLVEAASDADDVSSQVAAVGSLAAFLLSWHYDLTDDELGELLGVNVDDETATWVRDVCGIATGRSGPKAWCAGGGSRCWRKERCLA